VIEAARREGVEKLLVLGSACIYPRLAAPPVDEGQLLAGPLEPTNQWYAVAKIAAIKLAQAYRRQYGCDFIAAIPANLYGPHDTFDPEAGHVVPGLLRRMHDAKRCGEPVVPVWGSGRPRREFLHVDDLADALVHLLVFWSGEVPVNVGTGTDVSIAELARLIRRVVGYDGRLVFDPAQPDGAPWRRLDVTRLNGLGWQPRWGLEEGLQQTYAWLQRHWASARR
jgi:GDP-L-fucose synthase